MSSKLARRRAGVLLAVFLIGFLGIAVQLTRIQVVRSGEYETMAHRQRVREIDLPPTRGAIYDRRGRELAISVPARTIYANPKQIADPADVASRLAPVLELDVAALTEQLGRTDRGFVYVARRVGVDAARRVEELGLVGVGIVDEARRVYPSASLAANVIGFVGTDAEGLSGLEFSYEELLGGVPGSRVLEQDPLGRRIPQGVFEEVPPVPGSDLVLTIDRDIQHAADAALARAVEAHSAEGGSVVVLDPRTGEVLAMANHPTYDPNDLSTVTEGVTRNRAVTDVYEPGSVSKVVTAAGAIEAGVVTPQTAYPVPARMFYGGQSFSDSHGHPTTTMTFEDVIKESSNVGTIKVAIELGAERLQEYLGRFGYGDPTGLGFPGEVSGVLPSTSRWKTSLPTMAIGQGVSATLLQVARMYGAVANDGVMRDPKLVSGWVDPDGELHQTPDSPSRRVVRADVAEVLRGMLARVTEDGGTGTAARIAGYTVAGKTGTANKPSPSGGYAGYYASFVGMVPAEDPAIVIAITLDEPSPIWGGVVAAPVFAEVGRAAVRILRVPPTAPDIVPGGAEVAGAAASPERDVASGVIDRRRPSGAVLR